MVESKKLDKFSMLMKKIQRAYDFQQSIREYDRRIYREHFKTDKRNSKTEGIDNKKWGGGQEWLINSRMSTLYIVDIHCRYT